VVTTFTEAVAGEIVTLIFVTGSVQVDVEVVLELVELVVVHVTAVLAGAAPHEARPQTAMIKTKNNKRRLTAPLCSPFEIPDEYGSVSSLIPKMWNCNLTLAGFTPSELGFDSKFKPRERALISKACLKLVVDYAKRGARRSCIHVQNIK